MRAVQFSKFGGPEVLEVVEAPEPHAGPGEIRVVVSACGINPVDWKFRQGFMGGELPQGMGLEVAGIVDEVGDDVTDVTAGDQVFGPTSGGAADFAVLANWAHVPATLDLPGAAALPVAVETAPPQCSSPSTAGLASSSPRASGTPSVCAATAPR
jgi:NADPH:quinone reductase-like Zn-dependent oxidoreductase